MNNINYQQLANGLLNGLNPYAQRREILSVNGLNEAKSFNLERGENVILMDCNEDVVYVKSCDDMGKCILKVYSCTDITESVMAEKADGISKNDFQKLSDEVAELKTMLKGVVKEHNAGKSGDDSKVS